MRWFRIDSGFSRHPKTLRLCEELDDPNAGMYVIRLWEHCATYALDGVLSADIIEKAAGWTKARGKGRLTISLRKVGFIDEISNQYLVHDWEGMNGSVIRKSLKDNARPNSARRNPAQTPRGVRNGNITQHNLTTTTKTSEPAAQVALQPKLQLEVVPAPAEGEGNTATGPTGTAAPSPASKRDPLRRALSDALVAVYAVERQVGYGFDGAKDARALQRLLGFSSDIGEHARRFRLSLQAQGFYRCDSIARFATGDIWNHFATEEQGPRRAIGGMSDFTKPENREW